ncbi:bifunctional (p)ppGpp synthetase/guanosine-3',5'-bis(diphosphate) 3'-pyrophosphohydrolase [Candidatus Peregrinibacteria bacterium]|nr:bifunctional (p)ppGpp synthetase/guanosine-3',5'-bis(diphosphate) 3'-pyrophosphohydrolase [Candidatus Peregrinibacteria bacterium]
MSNVVPTIEEIIDRAKAYLPSLNEQKVRRAYYFAEEAHKDQTRFSGDPYIVHPLNVAAILLDFHPDENSIVTALLHDVAEDTVHTLDEIEKAFGSEIRELCWGLVKLSKVRSKLDDPQTENLRKLFLAMAKDFRVVLLKLCDRLHNMRTLEFVRPEKRKRIAQETLNIYAPIAARLGIYRLKSQLEDLCFQYLLYEEYENIQNQLAKTGKWREKYIETAKKILMETLSKEGIQAQVDGRVKSSYSIYRKMKKKNKTAVDEVFDVFAMRIILPDIYKYGKEYIGHIYTALGVLHNHFTPLANRFKDYIAVPKVNGYRSLHTTVIGLGPKVHTQPTEIQIRTESMHEAAEFGIAAHWVYEEDIAPLTIEAAKAAQSASFLQQQKDWISGLQKIEEEIKSNHELLENLRVDVFQDRIFVLTPRGDVKDLPVGATPVDFAYCVHTEVGNHCIGAKTNGVMVPLDHELKSGEVVEIVTRKNAKPSQHWLAFVKTNHARNRIRSWFRNLDEGKHLRDGKELLNEKLVQFGQPTLDVNLSVLRAYDGKNLSLKDREDVLCEIGKGSLLASAAVRKIFSVEELLMGGLVPAHRKHAGIGTAPPKKKKAKEEDKKPTVVIGGQSNVPYQFVQCCDADFSDELVGYITRGRGVSLHRKRCPVLKNSQDGRLVPVKVAHEPGEVGRYPVCITVEADDRVGLVRDISAIIAESSVNIIDARHESLSSENAAMNFVLEIESVDQLERVLSNLEKIPSVRRAFRVNSGSRA